MKIFDDKLWRFNFHLFRHLRDENADKNIFFSPLSVTVALSMTLLGARNRTAEQMLTSFELKKKNETDWHSFLGTVSKSGGKAPMTVANKMFVEQSFAVVSAYVEELKKLYAIEHGESNFLSDPSGAVLLINQWVNQATKGKIKQLLSSLDSDTRVVLVNAVHFKGFWNDQFEPRLTQPAPFHVTASYKVSVPLMFRSFSVPFYSGKLGSAVRLPFRDDGFSMLVILPPQGANLAQLEDQLIQEPARLAEVLKNAFEQKVDVFLPRFELRFSGDLKSSLRKCGMEDLFDPRACDLSGVSGARDLVVSAVVHEAVLEVNEEGAEAAAATAVVMKLRCMPMPKPQFRVDRPFVVAILKGDTAVFFGRVLDPTSK